VARPASADRGPVAGPPAADDAVGEATGERPSPALAGGVSPGSERPPLVVLVPPPGGSLRPAGTGQPLALARPDPARTPVTLARAEGADVRSVLAAAVPMAPREPVAPRPPAAGRELAPIERMRVPAPPSATVAAPTGAPAGKGAERVRPPRPARGAPSYWVQVGTFKSRAAVERLVATLRWLKLPVWSGPVPPSESVPGGETLSRVRVGPFPDRAQAVARLQDLVARGYQPFIAVTRE
jgi:cell division septation protein DedD